MTRSKLLILFALFISSIWNMNADFHGGEITWECHPSNGQYRFTVQLFKDCGINQSSTFPSSIVLSGPTSISCSFISITPINSNCFLGTAQGIDSLLTIVCGNPQKGRGAVEIGTYRSTWITLGTGSPIPATGWTFSWSSCCRPQSLKTFNSTGFSLRATMYPYTNMPSNVCHNSSPKFLEDPIVVAGEFMGTIHNNRAFDVENDSLFYQLVPSLDQNMNTVSYSTGYSSTSPLPDSIYPFNINNMALNLIGESGEMFFLTCDKGLYNYCIELQEWRNGQLISKVYREAIVVIRNNFSQGICPQTNNQTPTYSIGPSNLNYPNSNVNQVLNSSNEVLYHESNVYAGDILGIYISGYDSDWLSNCLSTYLTFSASGGNMSNATNYDDSSSCEFSNFCATINSLNTGGGLVSKNQNYLEFVWQTDFSHITYQNFANKMKVPYDFHFKFEDNGCPISTSRYIMLKVNVKIDAPLPPNMKTSCVDQLATSGDLIFDWVANPDTGKAFMHYEVYHSNSLTGPYQVIDTIKDFNQTSYTAYNKGLGYNYFFVRSAGNGLSQPSDTIALMQLGVTGSPSTNPTVANLNWIPHSSNWNGTVYQIWKRTLPAGTWTKIDSTTSLSYTDPISGSLANLDYKIAINGKCFSEKANNVSVDELDLLSDVKVGPIPFEDEIVVHLNDQIDGDQVQIRIADISGKIMTNFNTCHEENKIIINLRSSWASGTYLLQLTHKNQTKTFKVIH